ncbi:hypothetical protein V8F20_004273 [Naviculisporaceae sp. PSN 640]
MRFFKKKDKRKKDSTNNNGYGGGPIYGAMPGYGPGTSSTSSPPGYGGSGFRSGAEAAPPQFGPRPTRRSAMVLAQFDASILNRIFGFVCPHSLDESYETCEQSSIEDACMLCDLRDLAACVGVSKRWREVALKRLYHSIRIDTVHYCEREIYLSEERKKRGSFFDRNGEPEDPAQARLKLLCRTLREDPVRLGKLVRFFKTPYMLRESSPADLARTLAVTPHLRYVDLPEGLFADEPTFVTLRLEVQARCHDLRKMTYMRGSEHSLQALASGNVWTKLEVLELIRTNMDPAMLRQVLSSLRNLRALKLSDMDCVNDEVLGWHDMLPPFPPLEEFILTNTPYITGEGLYSWLQAPEAQKSLKVLTLNETGVKVWTLQEVLPFAPSLKHLSIIESVSTAMQAAAGTHNNIFPLASPSLETLHYEVTASSSAPKFSGVTASYYNYLASSLLSGGLPSLRALYVRDPNFPELLLGLPPPAPAFAGGVPRPSSSGSNTGFGGRQSMGGPRLGSPGPGGGGFQTPMGSPSNQNQYLNPFTPGHRPQGSLSSLGGSPQNGNEWKPGHRSQFSSNNPFASTLTPPGAPAGGGSIVNLPPRLEVFTKGDDEMDWSFVQVNAMGLGGLLTPSPASHLGGRGENGRPLSSYGLGADVMGGSVAGWSSGAGARKSVLIGGGAAGGGFLAVPSEGSPRGRVTGAAGGGGGNGARGRSPAGGYSSSYGGLGGGGGGNREREAPAEDLWPRPRPLSSAGESKRDLWR